MKDFKLLSRKLVLSVLLIVIATLFIIKARITDQQYGIVIMATVVTYIISKAMDGRVELRRDYKPTLLDRLRALLTREFIISVLTVLGMSYLLYQRHISSQLWMQVVFAIGGVYNISNSLEKI